MVTPSAIGSEKGTPSSMISAPFSNMERAVLTVVSISGSPAVIKVIRALEPLFLSSSKHLSIRFIFPDLHYEFLISWPL